MKTNYFILILSLTLLLHSCAQEKEELTIKDPRFHLKTVDLDNENLAFYWKDDNGNKINTFTNLEKHLKLKDQKLNYAMNGGMYLKDHSPQGLYIENGHIIKALDTVQKAFGNFYLQPNGVFGIQKNGKAIIQSSTAIQIEDLKYATQSGPMLVIDGKIHDAFNEGSKNVHIRNAVGILPDGKLLFALSKEKINFYDLATFFKKQDCKNALYLDGYVSRVYDLDNNIKQMDGNFGVLIAVYK
ncbi:phosphodiester glycosidase family protein [Nonlabens sp. Asnod3-A02]|uniref:phosphodiester glycosidase family protein n=1 Tax=Nonlabens sp. Asnod3-A02 TaxID=3160579 RepID=UPI0038635FF8